MNGNNLVFEIKNSDGTPFHGIKLQKSAFESTVMSLSDRISGEVYYNGALTFTMQEYIEYEGVKYTLVSPPSEVQYGLSQDDTSGNGMRKYSFEFYHPMASLSNFPFADIAVSDNEEMYLSESRSFSWIGKIDDYRRKLNKNLQETEWVCVLSPSLTQEKLAELSEVLSFENATIADALQKFYDTWEEPFIIDKISGAGQYFNEASQDYYTLGKRFVITLGQPSNEILVPDGQGGTTPYVFRLGQGVGLKSSSRTPKNNKIVTRIVGYGSEENIPYGYPQIRWDGAQDAEFTYGDHAGVYENVTIGSITFNKVVSYPIYDGIVDGRYVKLIHHPFTRKTLMPSVYSMGVFNKVSPYLPNGTVNVNYDANATLIDYYDADSTYPHPIDNTCPSVEIHQFEDVKPESTGFHLVADAYAFYDEDEEKPWQTQNGYHRYIQSFRERFSIEAVNGEFLSQEIESLLYTTALSYTGTADYFLLHPWNGCFSIDGTVRADDAFWYIYARITYVSTATRMVAPPMDEIIEAKVLRPTAPRAMQAAPWNDHMDEDGKYVQSYFNMQIPALGFDLYACASITEEMKITMRSGTCLGCTFNVAVDWADYKKNFYHADGTFDPIIHTQDGDGHVRDGEKYPDSTNVSIDITVQKDLETFGRIMPNVYQQPHVDDEFAILGISLPLLYVTSAETRLDEAMGEFLLENNVHYYEYPLTFDEHFFAENIDILSQISPSKILRFLYNGIENALFLEKMSVQFGNEPLPKYDLTLTDNIEVVLNNIGVVADGLSRMRVQLNELQKYYGENLYDEITQRLSRVFDDVALGKITFQQGLDALGRIILSSDIRSRNFSQGMDSTGNGWRIDADGNAELNSIRVRNYLEVVQLLINRQQGQEGDTLFTDNDQIESLEKIDDTYYVLFFKSKWDGYISNQRRGNILRGVINTFAAKQAGVDDETATSIETDGNNKFFTSWMLVRAAGIETDNTYIPAFSTSTRYIVGDVVRYNSLVYAFITTHAVGAWNEEHVRLIGTNMALVSLYADNDTPQNKNFPPCQLMAVARWGCMDLNELTSSELSRRQRSFYISTYDGRITKLVGVGSPKLNEANYGTTLGTIPDFISNWSISNRLISGRDYLYAQGIIVGDFIKVDRTGAPVVNYVDKGEWSATAKYLFNQYDTDSLQWETHDVWYDGAYYRNLSADNIGHVPDASPLYWVKLLRSGANGSCTHFAYATSADGSENFSTTMFSGATYIGTYTDTTVAGSTNYTDYAWTRLKGDTGARGKTGRNFYYKGKWEDYTTTDTFVVTDNEAPYFEVLSQGSANYQKYVFVGANGTYYMTDGNKPSVSNANWELMVTDFKYLISEAIFSAFAKLGSGIFNGDWLMSQYGTINGAASTNFQNFNAEHPNDNTGTNFIPNFSVDLRNGVTYQNEGVFRGFLRSNKISFPPTKVSLPRPDSSRENLFNYHDLVYTGGTSELRSYYVAPKANVILSGVNMAYTNIKGYRDDNYLPGDYGIAVVVLPATPINGYFLQDIVEDRWEETSANLQKMEGIQLRLTSYEGLDTPNTATQLQIVNVLGTTSDSEIFLTNTLKQGRLKLSFGESVLLELRYVSEDYGYQWFILGRDRLPIYST